MTIVDDTTTPLWTPPTAPEPSRVRHPAADPAWARPALVALLAGTALLYLVNLSASGYGNDFYAAAVQAGTKSWKAFLFGSFDSSNFITVDKPPASLWVMELSGRLFGFSSWSMLAPQAIEGVLAVAVLYAAVKRWFGAVAGLIAGLVLALTPVAVLMFRFNNPDALMTLLCVVACYCLVRAVEVASTRWLMLAGVAMGFAFLTKSLQPFTILPALAIAYLVAAPTTLLRRFLQLLAAGAAVLVSAGWWVVLTALWPVGSRPYIGGSGDNTVLGLAFGYNGLGRITGSDTGGPGGGGGGFGGSTGWNRMFNSDWGTQIAWLIPSALALIVAGVAFSWRRPRTDRLRAAMILWGGYLVVTAATLSFAGGVIHPYYAVQLAPAIAALVGIGGRVLWLARADINARIALAVAVGLAGAMSYNLLGRASTWNPVLRPVVLIVGVVAVAAILAPTVLRRMAIVVPVVALVAGGTASAAYAVQTASTAHTGSIPVAGPAAAAGGFGGGGFGRRDGGVGVPGGTGRPAFPGGGFPGVGFPGGATPPQGLPGNQTGGTARPGGSASADPALTALLKATTSRWAAATVGSQSAAPLQLASGKAIMAIGGFSGGDEAPTLAQFQTYVANGDITYFISGGGFGGGGRGGNSAIATWVSAHYSATTVGGTTVYDLRTATS